MFANTDESFEAALSLLDKNVFEKQVYITEYPVLTALARAKNPSLGLLNKLKSYLSSKNENFAYLRKLYLIYSALVHTYCKNNVCDESTLVNFLFLSKKIMIKCYDKVFFLF